MHSANIFNFEDRNFLRIFKVAESEDWGTITEPQGLG